MSTVIHMAQNRYKRDDEALCGSRCEDNMTSSRDGVTCWKCVHLLLGRPIPAEPECHEHDKLKAAKSEGRDATQLIGEFLDWLVDREGGGLVLAKHDDESHKLYRDHTPERELIADFFGINEAALDAEKEALIEYQRAYNKAIEWVEKEGLPHLARHP